MEKPLSQEDHMLSRKALTVLVVLILGAVTVPVASQSAPPRTRALSGSS